MDTAVSDKKPPKKTLRDRAQEALEGVLEVLESLVGPAPALVPVPVRPQQRPRRRASGVDYLR